MRTELSGAVHAHVRPACHKRFHGDLRIFQENHRRQPHQVNRRKWSLFVHIALLSIYFAFRMLSSLESSGVWRDATFRIWGKQWWAGPSSSVPNVISSKRWWQQVLRCTMMSSFRRRAFPEENRNFHMEWTWNPQNITQHNVYLWRHGLKLEPHARRCSFTNASSQQRTGSSRTTLKVGVSRMRRVHDAWW